MAAEHWEDVYVSRSTEEVSWYEREPETSLRTIDAIDLAPSATIVDVGAGASTLVDRLLTRGYRCVTVLDVAARPLDAVCERLGARAADVTFVVGDVLNWQPDKKFDLWHDRAVFHFLVDRAEQRRYAEVAARTVRSGGAIIIAGFAEDGPPHCSGLPVSRHSADDLAAVFTPSFTLVAAHREAHVTPAGAVQPFTWVTLRRS